MLLKLLLEEFLVPMGLAAEPGYKLELVLTAVLLDQLLETPKQWKGN